MKNSLLRAIFVYKGHVTFGMTRDTVTELEETGKNPFRMPPTGNESAVWVEPSRVCVVEYMPNTLQSLRQFEIQYIEKSWHLC